MWRTLSAALALLAWGCAPGAPPMPQTPESRTPTTVERPAEDDVQMVLPDGAVTLSELLRWADTNAPALRVADAQAALGDAELEGAGALLPYNPELSLSAGGRTVAGTTTFELEAGIEQRLELAGQRGTRLAAAERFRLARHAQREVVRWELHAVVHALYAKLLVQAAQLAAADKLAAFANALQDIVDKRVAAGEEAPLRAALARAEIARARQAVIAARHAHRTTGLQLAEVIGWPVQRPLAVLGALPEPEIVGDWKALAARAKSEHPSQRWLELELQAADARVAREDRRAWPDPSVGVSYAREAEAGGPAQHVWMATVGIPLPIWERNQSGRAVARAQANEARAERDAFEQRLDARIAGAVARVDAAAERVKLYGEDILPAFEENLVRLQRAFELGEIDILELAQIQGRILETNAAALDALEAYFEAVAALEALSGVEVLTGSRDE